MFVFFLIYETSQALETGYEHSEERNIYETEKGVRTTDKTGREKEHDTAGAGAKMQQLHDLLRKMSDYKSMSNHGLKQRIF